MRYLNLGTIPAEASQAVYHALADLMTPDKPITLVTVSPDRPYVCVGYHQVASREIDRPYCEAAGIPVGRRMVGGGAVWLDYDQIFWHLIMPRQHLPVDTLYRKFLTAPVEAYRKMGIGAEHRPVNDIVVGPRKIGGTGANTMGEADVLVGSIMMDFDTQAMARVINVPSEKFRDKMVSSLEDYMTTVQRELGPRAPSREEATAALVEAFATLLGEPVMADELTPEERRRLDYYQKLLFDPAFVYRHEGYLQPGVKIKDGVHLLEGVAKAPGGLVRVVWRESEGRIDDIVIGGDFFVNPANGLETAEQRLRGAPSEMDALARALAEVWAELDIPGVTIDDVLAAFQAGRSIAPELVGE
ncbi:lipoate--protein ligase [Sulfobacillus harzensis]|uniref:lipoate--protein ligase n=1 Tax=Sulfobacillus harzensis TaxID=2729629 RepID=A0A7Y0L254_9FIRM|nr:lipoate--protein ligase [Sulfobacillus harzensis]NMP21906.1 lipoate--protein ligase family protein [Sulfobacillus harzensis]